MIYRFGYAKILLPMVPDSAAKSSGNRDKVVKSRFILVIEKINYVMAVSYSQPD